MEWVRMSWSGWNVLELFDVFGMSLNRLERVGTGWKRLDWVEWVGMLGRLKLFEIRCNRL